MKRVYFCDLNKKADVLKVLEADPYADDSFARVGYKIKEGAVIGEDKSKLYIYVSASDEFIKKADERMRGLVSIPPSDDVEQRVIKKIVDEEEQAESGFGSIFGE